MIIDTLNLEDVVVDDIDPDQALFQSGLGLDSIDALELSLAISTRYGVEIRAEDTDVGNIFGSLRSLTKFIVANRKR